jgi:hypothetical protein
VEVDKILNRLDARNCTFGDMTEVTGCVTAVFQGCRFTGSVWARPYNAVYEDCRFEGQGTLGPIRTMLFNPTRNGISLAVRRCRFAPVKPDELDGRFAIDMVGPHNWDLRVVTVNGADIVVPDHGFDTSAFLRPDLPFFTVSKTCRGIVRTIRRAELPEHLLLSISFTGEPLAAGDLLQFPSIERVQIEGCETELPPGYRPRPFRMLQPFSWNHRSTSIFRHSIQDKESERGFEWIFGWVSRLEIDVRKPYTGPQASPFLYLEKIASPDPQQHRIDLRKAGLRSSDVNAGIDGAHNSDLMPPLFISQWNGFAWYMGDGGTPRLHRTPEQMPQVEIRLIREPFPDM